MKIPPRKLLNRLVVIKAINQSDAERYEIDIIKKNIPVDDYLFNETKIPRETIIKSIGEVLSIPVVDIQSVAISPQSTGMVSEAIAERYNIIPFAFDSDKNSLSIATNNVFDVPLKNFLEKKTSKKIIFYWARLKDIEIAIKTAYTKNLSPEVSEALKEVGSYRQSPETQNTTTIIKEAPIAKIINTILEFAMKSRASDIHIEPEETRTRVRYRIDGILREKLSLPKIIHDALVSRIKILAEMKIDEKRVPQDGRFSFASAKEAIDLRVSSLPTVHGEKIVMRLLKKTGGLPTLIQLGLSGSQLKDIQQAITVPYGIILVTGPTGSGKTTTLYSILTMLNKPTVNIMTLEDPVEYQIEGINQVQINPQAGLTFANGLRSFLRQDPNIILVGEIRDKETTQLAIQAALTGHLVFSTLHTNDAATAIPRLIDLGGEPFLIASVLNTSLAQRIVRRVCPHCKESYDPDMAIQKDIRNVLGGLLPKEYEKNPIKLSRGKGCPQCNYTGYLGRVGIFEVLKISSKMNKMILEHSTVEEINNQAKKEGLISMKQDGYLKALQGITSIEEILRVAED